MKVTVTLKPDQIILARGGLPISPGYVKGFQMSAATKVSGRPSICNSDIYMIMSDNIPFQA
jgi:hypothetical protein